LGVPIKKHLWTSLINTHVEYFFYKKNILISRRYYIHVASAITKCLEAHNNVNKPPPLTTHRLHKKLSKAKPPRR
jgi:hypothetical protein